MTDLQWEEVITTSYYLATVEIKKKMEAGKNEEAYHGLNQLIAYQKKSEQREVLWKLRDLMTHVLLGISVPQKRTRKWNLELFQMRNEFEDNREDVDFLDDNYIKSIWNRAFQIAKENVEILANKTLEINLITWKEIFEKEYSYQRKTPASNGE